MKIKKKKIGDNIILLIFENQFDITSTFLRFQEYYESPKFRGKIFSLEKFKKWYTEQNGQFSYFKDWNGFNIPSEILEPFYYGKFNPLSLKEEKLLQLLKLEKGRFYLIGVHRDVKKISALLNHEVAHGLFYTDNGYRKIVLKILEKYNLKEIKKELRSKSGYHEDVLDDEVHAYSLDTVYKLKAKIPITMQTELLKNFKKALEKNKISLKNNYHLK